MLMFLINIFFLCETGHTDDGSPNAIQEEQKQLRAGDWARVLEAATQRRTEVLMPENLENMWSRGRNYRKQEAKRVKGGEVEEPLLAKSACSLPTSDLREFHVNWRGNANGQEEKTIVHINNTSVVDTSSTQESDFEMDDSLKDHKKLFGRDNHGDEPKDAVSLDASGKRSRLKRSSSTSDLEVEPDPEKAFTGEDGGHITSVLYGPSLGSHSEKYKVKNFSDAVYPSEGPHTPKLRCRVRKSPPKSKRK